MVTLYLCAASPLSLCGDGLNAFCVSSKLFIFSSLDGYLGAEISFVLYILSYYLAPALDWFDSFVIYIRQKDGRRRQVEHGGWRHFG